jgi:hypothetical protein
MADYNANNADDNPNVEGNEAYDDEEVEELFTVEMAMVSCNVTADQATTLATELFGNDFTSCKDKSDEDLRDDFKTFATFEPDQGQIRLKPRQKKAIKAFNQWAKDMFRLGGDPELQAFPVEDMNRYIERAKSHAEFVADKDTIVSTAKPEKLTKDMKWEDWAPSFINFLRAIPGRDGVPLKYVIRDNEEADSTTNEDFLDDYVACARLKGAAFAIDAARVHTYIVSFISQNDEAESAIKVHEMKRNGRLDWKALKSYYEGMGMHKIDIAKAEVDIETLFYAGEKKPHMWWAEFERRLNFAFQTFVKHEGREVYSDEMKLRILLRKIKADWLMTTKKAIEVGTANEVKSYTYEHALSAFRNEVNAKFPPGTTQAKSRRTMQELTGRGSGGGRGFQRGGRGSGRGRGRGRSSYRSRSDSKMITLKTGKQIEYHPSFNFPRHIFEQFKDEDIETLKRQRREYKERKSGSKRSIESLQAENEGLRAAIAARSVPAGIIPTDERTSISNVTTDSIMGGRNEQASNKRPKTMTLEIVNGKLIQ